jgi:hypothetical protein
MLKFNLIPVLLLTVCLAGCENQQNSSIPEPTPQQKASNQAIMQEIQKLEQEAAQAIPPEPVIPLPDLPGWTHSPARALPAEDHGFSVGYSHGKGMQVTYYQFTRGLKEIPDNLNSEAVQNEMKTATAGIEQAVELGIWKAAQEIDHGTVSLGDSSQKALWSRYRLTTDQGEAISDTYVWPYANTLFKLRCTGHAKNPIDDVKVLTPLLTALGNECSEKKDQPAKQ